MAEEEYYTLFIDTSFDTHLATIISDSATVSDVKKKIVLEHGQLFPSIGEIKILSVQVKRQGHFYHLPDSMLVVNAYEGSKRHKSLFVEASASEHDKGKDIHAPEIKGRSSSEVSDHEIVGVETTLDHDGHSIPTMKKRQKEASRDHVETSPSDANATPGVLRTSYSVPATDKCPMLLPSEAGAVDPTAELGVNSRTSPMKHKSTNMEDLASLNITAVHEKHKVSVQPQGQGIPLDMLASVAIHVDEDGQKELALNHDCQVMLSASYKPSDQSDAERTNDESIVGPKVLVMGNPIEIPISDGAKRKKRGKKKSSVVQADSVGKPSKASGPNSSAVLNLDAENLFIDNIDKNNCILPQTENDECNLVEVEKGLSANQDLEEIPDFFKPAGQGESEVANKEVILSPTSLHPIEAMEAVQSSGNKGRKRKTKESAAKIQDKMKMENQLNAFSGISPLAQDVAVHNQMTENDKKSESDLHSLGTGQIGKIAGDSGESLKQNKSVIPTRSKPLESGGTNANTNDSVTTIMMFDAKDLKTGSRRKKRRTKLSTEMEETKSKNDLSNVTERPANVVMDEAMNAQKILTEDLRKTASESTDVSASVIQRKGEKFIENEEVLLPPTEEYQNQEITADMDENVKEVVKNNQSRDNNGGATVKPAKGQPDDLQDLVLEESGRYQENDSIVNRKEKKKRKKGQIYAAANVSNLEIKNHEVRVEESAVSGEILKDIENEEVLLPPTEVYQNQENTADMDENVKEVVKNNQSRDNNGGATVKPTKGQPDDLQDLVLEQSGRYQENGSNVNRKEKKKRKKGQIYAAANALNLEIKNHEARVEESAVSGEILKGIENEEALLPPTEVYQNQENTADMDENVEVVTNNQSRDSNGGATAKPAKGQPDDLQGLVLEHSGRYQENDSNVNRKEKKKRKKGQIYAAANVSNLETKNHEFRVEESAVSGEILKGMDSQSKTAKIGKPTDGGAAIQSNALSFEIEKDPGTKLGGSIPEPAQIGATSSDVPLKGRPETHINDQGNLETAKCEDEGINCRPYFVPGQPQNEVGSSGKVKEASESTKSKKKKDKHNDVTETTWKLSETNGKGKPSDGRNVNDNKLEESTEKQNEELQMVKKKTSIASHDGVKAPTSSDVVGNKALKKFIKPAVASGSQGGRAVPARWEGNKGSSTALGLSSKSKGSGKVKKVTTAKQQPSFNYNAMSTRKYSSNGSVLKSSGREKNLLTTERKLFTSSGSSDDENKMLNSSSTRTPSDNSSSSGSSTGESDSSLDSKRKEPKDAKKKAVAGKSISSKEFSAQYLSMDEVLKSSSRFKKAKLAASQSQDGDTENWPDDVVPDSQAKL